MGKLCEGAGGGACGVWRVAPMAQFVDRWSCERS